MGSRLTRSIIPALTALVLAAAPAVQAGVDYSKNGATGQYVPQIVHKNYSLNGATGDYRPPVTSAPVVAPAVPPVGGSGFSWADAALGAGIALLVAFVAALTTRRIRRRRIPAPSPARPTAA